MEYLVEPNVFSTSLRAGAPVNDFKVTAVWFKAGARFKRPMPGANDNVLLATFHQKR